MCNRISGARKVLEKMPKFIQSKCKISQNGINYTFIAECTM
jgi:hypothetical protein